MLTTRKEHPSELRGVEIFGFGVILPMSLITNSVRIITPKNNSMENTVACASPVNELPNGALDASYLSTASPTRVPSSGDVMHLQKRGGDALMSGQLLQRVVEKAQIGQFIMEIDDI